MLAEAFDAGGVSACRSPSPKTSPYRTWSRKSWSLWRPLVQPPWTRRSST